MVGALVILSAWQMVCACRSVASWQLPHGRARQSVAATLANVAVGTFALAYALAMAGAIPF